ncbi:MAG: type II secretion system protein [Planctomycetes bacterium]|nr:type II secretion system protein [Planctomycetota bacterium]
MRRTGFSLAELLVVLAIIAVLSMLLLPAMRVVKDAAVSARCASNLRQVGMHLLAFAADNNGRMVGQAYAFTGTASWCDIINTEMLSESGAKLPRWGDPAGSDLLCPGYVPSGQLRCFTYNRYAAGGNLISGKPEFGVVVDPPEQRDAAYAGWKFYCLGAALARFATVSMKVMLQDSMSSNDHCVDATQAKFRHAGGRVANFAFLDGRVSGYPYNPWLYKQLRHDFN